MPHQGYQYQNGGHLPLRSGNHGTSSAFSASANPDEDWTQISDLAERRRIQNRIAQRNYRKKLKRRLEDLERRAGSSSASPPSTYNTIEPSPSQSSRQHRTPVVPSSRPSQKLSPRNQPQSQPQQYTPPTHPDDELFSQSSYPSAPQSRGHSRDGSNTPPLFSYGNPYTTQEPSDPVLLYPSYTASPSYGDYLAPAPHPTLPPMHFTHDLGKDDGLNGSYGLSLGLGNGMSYASMAGLDSVHSQGSLGFEDPNTPPFSHTYDACHLGGASCGSANEWQYPGTPLSMPASPARML